MITSPGCQRRREVGDEQVLGGDRALARTVPGRARWRGARPPRRAAPRSASPWASEPPMVPRWRTRTLPIIRAASASIGQAARTASECSSSTWRVSADRISVPSRASIRARLDAAEVDQRARLGQSQHHHRHQALAARDHPSVLAGLAQTGHRVLPGAGAGVVERCRVHPRLDRARGAESRSSTASSAAWLLVTTGTPSACLDLLARVERAEVRARCEQQVDVAAAQSTPARTRRCARARPRRS